MKKIYKTQFGLFPRFLKLLLPYRRRWLLILMLSNLGALLSLINPYLTKMVVDNGIVKKELKVFVVLTFFGAGVFILNEVINGFGKFLNGYMKRKISFDLNKKVFKHLQNLSFGYFSDRSNGQHLFRIHYDIERIAELVTTIPPQAVAIFPKLLFTLAIVFYLNWQMALLLLILSPVLYLINYYFTGKMRNVWKAFVKQSESIFNYLQEIFSHMQLIKVFGKEQAGVRTYLKSLIVNIRLQLKNIKLEIFSGVALNAVNKFVLGIVGFLGGYQVIKGGMSLGTLTAIMVYVGQLVILQRNFAHFFQMVAVGLVSCERVAEILDEDTKIIQVSHAKDFTFPKGQIIFQDVSFGYYGDNPVLKKISFSMEGGKHVALVGPSGCGKTTLLNLIVRLYDPWSGEILIDGERIRGLKLSSLKEQIGVALQRPFLLNDSVKNNIGYGMDVPSEKEILEISKICGVSDFVGGLPQQYDTVIGEDACKISEGQKQKIAIARALAKKPKILILDEAFSSMDSISEEIIIKNLKKHLKSTTFIVSSHRLSTVMSADAVYFLNADKELQNGPPRELLARDSDFHDLFAAQIDQSVYH